MVIARQSTARTVMVGPVLDASGVAVTDGVVGDFKISKNGGAPAALNGSATLTHRHTGHYSLALTTSDLDTVGQAEVCIDDTVNACPVKVLTVVEEAVYDALFAASALGYVANAPVNVAQFGGSNLTSASGIPAVNMLQISGDATAADNLESAFDDTVGANRWTGIIDQGTAQAVTGTTIRLRAAAAFADDELNGCWVVITGGTTGVGQVRQITDYASATDTATVDTWTTTPTGTITYQVLPGAMLAADVAKIAGAAVNTASAQLGVNVVNAAGTAWASGAITAAVIATGAIDADAIADNAIDAGAIAADAITSAKIADNAITANKIAADAITAGKIANGAIDAATFAADVDAEFLSYIVDDATRIDASALNTATGTTIPDILTDTAEIGAAGAGLTNINLPNQTMDIVGNITGNLSGSVGSVTAGVTLANDAITAAKFDETTAFPLKADDSGSTQVARVGSDGDTLETLSDQLDAKASQASVDDLPTNAELATSQAGADDATLAAIASLDTKIGTPAVSVSADIADVEGKVDDLETRLGTPSDLGTGATVGANLTDVGTALTAFAGAIVTIDGVVDAIKVTTDKLDDTLEDDAGTFRFTENALEEAPSGGGGSSDWNADERTAIRTILGIPASGTTPDTPTDGVLDDIMDRLGAPVGASIAADIADVEGKVDDIETRIGTPSNLGSGATVAANLVDIEGQTDDIGAAGAGLTALATAAELAKVPKSDGTATWNATALASLQAEATDALNAYDPPTHAELTSGLTGADDATLAAIAALNNLSSAQAQTAAAAALTAYDPPTRTEATADKDEILATTADIEGKVDDLEGRLTSGRAANLDNLDATVSSRLAASGYTAPPSAATTASAVRTELATELGRVDVAVSTRATPAQVNTEADQALADAGVTTVRLAKLDGLPEGLRRNVAFPDFTFFMADDSDHVSGQTGLTVTAQRRLDDGAFGVCANSPTEVGSGFYTIDLEASDLDGVMVTLLFTAAGADPRSITLKTSS